MNNSRAIAARQLAETIARGHAFEAESLTVHKIDPRDIGLAREICFGTLRHFFLLDALLNPFLKKPLPKKDTDIHALLLAGLYQLRFMQTPQHAAINSSVEACAELGKPWAKGLVNAVLRNLVRNQLHSTSEFGDPSVTAAQQHSHPQWLYEQLQRDWPNQFQQIIDYNNSPPAMTLRLDTRSVSPADYLDQLEKNGIAARLNTVCDSAITLEQPAAVSSIPFFGDGIVSVQDAGAQRAAGLLDIRPGHSVLDACAAPGGKSVHILQMQPDVQLTSLDNQASRLSKLQNEVDRCGLLSIQLVCDDAARPEQWWNGELFDRILVDAPCSGTGIISHHPDIKLLRRPGDASKFAHQQSNLLYKLWPLLKPEGKLLYCTCSVLPEENEKVVSGFLEQRPDATLDALDLPDTTSTGYGYQLLPNKGKNGGFFFARLSKSRKL